MEQVYDDPDGAARTIFEEAQRLGPVVVEGGQYDTWAGKREIRGVPELRQERDGGLYPLQAVFRVCMENEVMRVELRLHFGQLKARAYCRPGQLPIAERLLQRPMAYRVGIRRGFWGEEDEPQRLFARIKALASRVSLGPGHGKLPLLEVDRDGRLVPYDAVIDAWIEGERYRLTFYQREITVDGPVEHLDLLQEWMAPEPPPRVRTSSGQRLAVESLGWDQVGGLEPVVGELRRLVEYPLRSPEAFQYLDIEPPRGVLLVGPPGTGKTLLARILAHQISATFLVLSPHEVFSPWYGASTRLLAATFSEARREADRGQPVLLFIDELDGFCGRRAMMHEETRRLLGQLLAELDGIVELRGVMVLGASNRPEDLDPALLRPGRFDRKLLVPPPDKAGREAIFRVHCRRKPLDDDVDFGVLAAETEDMVGADIANICSMAAHIALERYAGEHRKAVLDLGPEDLAGLRIRSEDFRLAISKAREEQKTVHGDASGTAG